MQVSQEQFSPELITQLQQMQLQQQYSSGSIQNNPNGTLNTQILDTSPIIEQMDRLLRGYVYLMDAKTQKYSLTQTTPLLPEDMINTLMTHIQARFNPGTPLGYLTENDAKNFTSDFCIAVCDWLVANYEDNKDRMKTKGFDLILSSIEFMTYNILTRAIKGRTQEGIFNINKINFGSPSQSQSEMGGGGPLKVLGRSIGLPV